MTPSQLASLRRLLTVCEVTGEPSEWAREDNAAYQVMRAYVDARTPGAEAVAFFYEWAGWSYDPALETENEGRERGAYELAEAELLAKLQEWEYRWVDDSDEVESEGCQLRHGEHVLASLWAIQGADDNYRRVVQAELALEALSSMV